MKEKNKNCSSISYGSDNDSSSMGGSFDEIENEYDKCKEDWGAEDCDEFYDEEERKEFDCEKKIEVNEKETLKHS